jgi:hypothetical protein
MADAWTVSVDEVELSNTKFVRPSPTPTTLAPLVQRALRGELTRRRELRPHAQLGVALGASVADVEAALTRLQRQYDPQTYAAFGDDAVASAASIVKLLRDASARMRSPGEAAPATEQNLLVLPRIRRDDTQRALETLRGAIARRLAEADAHRAAGRVADAVRVMESVLILDRSNEVARAQLLELRARLQPPAQHPLKRWWTRVFSR